MNGDWHNGQFKYHKRRSFPERNVDDNGDWHTGQFKYHKRRSFPERNVDDNGDWHNGQFKYHKRRSFPERNVDNNIFGCPCPETTVESGSKHKQNVKKTETKSDTKAKDVQPIRDESLCITQDNTGDITPEIEVGGQINQEIENIMEPHDDDLSQDKKTTEVKMRQWLFDTSPELRDLTRKLQAAYVAKEQATQLAEKEHERIEEMQRKEDEKNIILAAVETQQKKDIRDKKVAADKKENLKRGLHRQLIHKHQVKQERFEEFVKEKQILDNIVQRLHDEDTRATEEKMRKRLENKADIDSFLKARKLWREDQKRKIQAENEKINSFVNTYENIVRKHEEDRKNAAEDRSKTSHKLGQKLQDAWNEQQRIECVRQEYKELEKKQKEEERLLREKKQNFEYKVNLRNALRHQMQEKRVRSQQEDEEDRLYRQQMIQKLAEERKIDMLTAEKKRLKLIEIRQEISEHINERRAQRVDDMVMKLHLREQEKLQEASRTRVIEDERNRLLKEHAMNLIGFLPPGILREDETEYLTPGN